MHLADAKPARDLRLRHLLVKPHGHDRALTWSEVHHRAIKEVAHLDPVELWVDSADLLRYLHVQRRLHGVVGAIPVALVTVGSPLRDLYAERFPLLYEWMGSSEAGFTTAAPSASDLGATEWVNACRSGDYVGRFIWTPPSDKGRFRIALVDSDGKVEAQRAGDRTEFCLGAGGHTHYFSNDAVALAVEIDRLIAG